MKKNLLFIFLILLLLPGCLTQEYFLLDGVKYNSKIEALNKATQNNSNVLSGIYPSKIQTDTNALVVINTMRRLEDTAIVYDPNKESTKRVYIDYLSEYFYNAYKNLYESLKIREFFSKVDFITSYYPENTENDDYDYIIYLYNPNPQSSQWFIKGKTLNKPQLINFDHSRENQTLKTISWLESIETTVREDTASSPRPPNIDKEKTPASFGTGFAISKTGIIVTAYHVVDGHNNISVKFESGKWLPATIVKYSKSNDIAILTTGQNVDDFLELTNTKGLKQADRVFTMGYPATYVLGVEPKYTEGYISSLSGLQGEDSLMQISVPIQPGNSGGPLVDSKGQVVGLITSTAAVSAFYKITGSLPQNINWAVKSDYISLLVNDSALEKNNITREPVTNTRKSICFIKSE